MKTKLRNFILSIGVGLFIIGGCSDSYNLSDEEIQRIDEVMAKIGFAQIEGMCDQIDTPAVQRMIVDRLSDSYDDPEAVGVYIKSEWC